ncbi:abscisic acid receptor PYL11-like [Punica granatum]|uniref:Abscisic acid receptor PYL11-like n=1 Tax=Punica granatum TaxID=22663 RepID=A0A218XQ60_PUNGR|nr:abscisic acid receptor PYL11-like [Punica granatum]OWM87117.1 hypothetical protein CDL15_Pgr005008 [Punica granatum]
MDPNEYNRTLLSSQLNLTNESLSKLNSVIRTHHRITLSEKSNWCKSLMIQPIKAPETIVWSFVRDFSQPQKYKHFIKTCQLTSGDGITVGSIRDLVVISGLPASMSKERLEVLDDENQVLSFRVLGGDHRLKDYQSVTSVNALSDREGRALTLVVESYVVEVPEGNTAEDTRSLADTIVRLNLQNLAEVSVSAAGAAATAKFSSSSSGEQSQDPKPSH